MPIQFCGFQLFVVMDVIYEAEAILDEVVRDGVHYFLVKWVGYDNPQDNTWEQESSLTRCRRLLREFRAHRDPVEPEFPSPPTGPSPYAHFTMIPPHDSLSDSDSVATISSVTSVWGELHYRCTLTNLRIVTLPSADLRAHCPDLLCDFLIDLHKVENQAQ
jgi:hypothetical protein